MGEIKKEVVNEKFIIVTERRALKFTMILSAVAAISGLWMFILLKSEAIKLDGVFSLINLVAALIASRVAIISIRKPADKSPFGTQSSENVFLLLRSLFLTSYLFITLLSAVIVILTAGTYNVIDGSIWGVDARVVLGSYAVMMAVISTTIILNNKRLNKRIDNKSEILKLESKAAFLDAAISLGATAALIGASYIPTTSPTLTFFHNYGDQVVVVILVLILVWEPLFQLIEETKRLSGLKVADDHKLEKEVKRKVRKFLKNETDGREKFLLKDTYAVKRGKHADIFLTISFRGKKTLEELDKIRDEIQDRLEETIPQSDIDIIWTNYKLANLD